MVGSRVKDVMETQKQETLESFRSTMLREIHGSDRILDKLEKGGLVLNRVEPTGTGGSYGGGSRTWLLFWAPPEHLRECFDLAPELLLVLTPWREAQARDVSAAEEALRRDHRR